MTIIYQQNYTGYVYIWQDKKHNMFYIGSHYGNVSDNYICSSKWMLNAYNKRPEDFKMRILSHVSGTIADMQQEEQRWLDMINDNELSTSKNVTEGCNRYYNMKKSASGGCGSANKGNSNIGGWNRGLTKHTDDRVANNGKLISKNKIGKKFSREHRVNMSIARGGDGLLTKKHVTPYHLLKPTSYRYTWVIKDPSGILHTTISLNKFSKLNNIGRDTLRCAYLQNREILSGNGKGWRVISRKRRM